MNTPDPTPDKLAALAETPRTDEQTYGLHEFNGALSMCRYNGGAWVPADFARTLERELAVVVVERDNAIRETVRMEAAVIVLPTFNANGPGDCADRQIAAITQLRAENEKLKKELRESRRVCTEQFIAKNEAQDIVTHLKAELERANAEIAAWNDLYSNGPTAAQIAAHLNPKKTTP